MGMESISGPLVSSLVLIKLVAVFQASQASLQEAVPTNY
jgi:hypothetical protein